MNRHVTLLSIFLIASCQAQGAQSYNELITSALETFKPAQDVLSQAWTTVSEGYSHVAEALDEKILERLTPVSDYLPEFLQNQNLVTSPTAALLATGAALTAYRMYAARQYTRPAKSEYRYLTIADDQLTQLTRYTNNLPDLLGILLYDQDLPSRHAQENIAPLSRSQTEVTPINRWQSNLIHRISPSNYAYPKGVPQIEQWGIVSLNNSSKKSKAVTSGWFDRLGSRAYHTLAWTARAVATAGLPITEQQAQEINVQQEPWTQPENVPDFFRSLMEKLVQTWAQPSNSQITLKINMSDPLDQKDLETLRDHLMRNPEKLYAFLRFALYQLGGEIYQLIDHAIATPLERAQVKELMQEVIDSYLRWVVPANKHIQSNSTYETILTIPDEKTPLYKETQVLQATLGQLYTQITRIMEAQTLLQIKVPVTRSFTQQVRSSFSQPSKQPKPVQQPSQSINVPIPQGAKTPDTAKTPERTGLWERVLTFGRSWYAAF